MQNRFRAISLSFYNLFLFFFHLSTNKFVAFNQVSQIIDDIINILRKMLGAALLYRMFVYYTCYTYRSIYRFTILGADRMSQSCKLEKR